MEYKGPWNSVNDQPKGDEWIEIFASDWFKEHWALYRKIVEMPEFPDVSNDLVNCAIETVENV